MLPVEHPSVGVRETLECDFSENVCRGTDPAIRVRRTAHENAACQNVTRVNVLWADGRDAMSEDTKPEIEGEDEPRVDAWNQQCIAMIRQRRRGMRLSIEAASARMGMNPRHLQKIETGETSPTLRTLCRIAIALRTTPGALLAHREDVEAPAGGATTETRSDLRRRIGTSVRSLRLTLNLTQLELAVRARVSAQYVQRVEAGRHNPTVLLLERIAHGLGVSIVELLRETAR